MVKKAIQSGVAGLGGKFDTWASWTNCCMKCLLISLVQSPKMSSLLCVLNVLLI